MHPLGDRDIPRPPAIGIAVLRRLLDDLPGTCQIISDDAARYVLIDEDEHPRGYLDIAHTQIVLLDGLSDGDDK